MQNELSVVDLAPSEFELLVHFIYTGQDCFITVHDCCVGLYAGDRFSMTDLKVKCSKRLWRLLQKDSSIAPLIVKFIDRFNCRNDNLFLYNKSTDIIWRDYRTIINSDTVATYDRATMEQLLEMSIEGAVPEIEVFRALLKWARRECVRKERDTVAEELRQVCGDMVHLIRFPLMTAEELVTEVMESGLLSDEHMKLLLHRAFNPTLDVPFIVDSRQSVATNRQVTTIIT